MERESEPSWGYDTVGAPDAEFEADLEQIRREVERLRMLVSRDRGLLEAILHHSPHGIIVCDANGRLILQNRASERIWAGSATAENVEGWGKFRAFHPDGRPYAPEDWSMARCLSRREVVQAEEVHIQRFDGSHGTLIGSCAPIFDKNGELEGALSVFADVTQLRLTEDRLRLVTNALPVLIAYVDSEYRYQFNNNGYEHWFGQAPAMLEGRHVSQVLGDEAFASVRPYMERALAGETVTFQSQVPYRRGGMRFIEAMYVPDRRRDGSVRGFVGLISDISERKRLEDAKEEAFRSERSARLRLDILAQASRVFSQATSSLPALLDAIVKEVATRIGDACTIALIGSDGVSFSTVVTHDQDPEASLALQQILETLQLKVGEGLGGRVAATGDAVLIPKLEAPEALAASVRPEFRPWLERYPVYSLIAVPLRARNRIIGTFSASRHEPDRPYMEEDLRLFEELADRAAMAVENARLLEAERTASLQSQLLYRLTDAVHRAGSLDEVLEAALDAIDHALQLPRASVLLFDDAGVMRFRAWRGLSDGYRAAVEGHSPWSRDELFPTSIFIPDVHADPMMAPFLPLFEREGIAALAFVPLVYESHLLGKFMLYCPVPRVFTEREQAIARSIGDQVAAAAGRKLAQQHRERLIEELSETVRMNELFAGALGHDLRNPLGAILTSAQLILNRPEGERIRKPAARILTSGERMARMIEQLLDFTRIRAGSGIPLFRTTISFSGLIKQVVGEVETAHPDCNIVVEVEGSCEGTWDPDRLSQVVSNLVGNAREHRLAGTAVSVRFDGRDPNEVTLRVSNVGTIAKEVRDSLFDPFRGARHGRAKAEGLGLGLHITREIVLAHDGQIDFETSPTETSFVVSLPRRSPEISAIPSIEDRP